MGAFETFVNANLGIRKPLITDVGPPSGSQKAAGIVGSEYLDSDTNFLYERTGENNNEFDWVFTRKLGDSLSDFSSGISEDFSSDLSIISGNLNSTGQTLQQEIDELSGRIGTGSSSNLSSDIAQVSGKFNTLSASLQLPSGVNDLSIKYTDFGLSDYENKPNVVVGLTYDSQVAPLNFYSYALYNVTTSGFNVSFSSDIEDQNLSLDFFVNGSTLSGQYQEGVESGTEESGTVTASGDSAANILSRTDDPTGTILYGTDTNSLYIYDGSGWQIYNGT